MLAKIGWYVFFLAVLVVYFVLATFLQKRQDASRTSKKGGFFTKQIVIATSLIPMVLIPWILTGFFSRTFLLLLLAAFEISFLFSYISSYLFRLTPREVGFRSSLWSGEVLLKHPYCLGFVTIFLIVVVLGGYFVVATYVYIVNPLHSDNAVHQILLMNFGLFVVGGLITAIPGIAQISSPHINDRTRAVFFLSQITSALQISIIITVYLRLMGVSSSRFVPQSLTLPEKYADYVPVVVLVAFYLVVLVIPYFVGSEGRRRAEISLYGSIVDRINKIIDAIGIPGEKDVEQLGRLRDEFVSETDEWINSEPFVKELAVKVERGATDQILPHLLAFVEPYRALKDQDPRFIKLSWTDEMKAKFEEMLNEYNRYATQPNRVRMFIMLGRAFAEYFRDQRGRYEGKVKDAEGRRVLTPVLTKMIPVLGAVPVVLEFGKLLTNALFQR